MRENAKPIREARKALGTRGETRSCGNAPKPLENRMKINTAISDARITLETRGFFAFRATPADWRHAPPARLPAPCGRPSATLSKVFLESTRKHIEKTPKRPNSL